MSLWQFFLMIPFFVQAVIIAADEFCFHVKRGLPKWERIGHPLDTLTVFFCFLFTLAFPYSPFLFKVYVGISIFSCLFVTKDEFIHKEFCPASEQWLHALLFLNHPILLSALAILWPICHGISFFSWTDPLLSYQKELLLFLWGQTAGVFAFLVYQVLYWNVYRTS